MPNFFTENEDILFQFEKLDLEEIVALMEDNYSQAEQYNFAPVNYADALENYRRVLEIAGDLAGNFIAPRAMSVDEEGNTIVDGKVKYAKGLQENLKYLTDAELMAVEFPRRFGGLNFPKTIYMAMVEVVSRADASLMNIFGLQDIAMTIEKFTNSDAKHWS